MRGLDRSSFKIPRSWQRSTKKAFPDYDSFAAKAAAFEALGLDDPVRRAGFKNYAVDVLPRKGKKGICDFKAIWGRLKRALAAMSHQKCAYCETPINAERSAAVEHFKPKSLFPLLVYDCGNYFLGCGGCNGAKSDKWPLDGGSYVRPDEGDPAALFVFYEDGRMEAAHPGETAEDTIRDFDLNRDWLCELRKRAIADRQREIQAISLYGELVAKLEIGNDQIQELQAEMGRDAWARLREPNLAYSTALTQCFERAWSEKFPGQSL